MDYCVICGKELDYEGTLVCYDCEHGDEQSLKHLKAKGE